MEIGEKIKKLRKERKLTQKQLGELSGTSEITIRQYETNRREPRMGPLIKIATALNVNVSELLELESLPMKIEKSEEGEKIYIESAEAQRHKAFLDYLEKDGIYISLYEEGKLEERDNWLFLMEDKRAGDSCLITSSELDELEERILSYSRFQISEFKRSKLKGGDRVTKGTKGTKALISK